MKSGIPWVVRCCFLIVSRLVQVCSNDRVYHRYIGIPKMIQRKKMCAVWHCHEENNDKLFDFGVPLSTEIDTFMTTFGQTVRWALLWSKYSIPVPFLLLELLSCLRDWWCHACACFHETYEILQVYLVSKCLQILLPLLSGHMKRLQFSTFVVCSCLFWFGSHCLKGKRISPWIVPPQRASASQLCQGISYTTGLLVIPRPPAATL